MSNVEPGRSPDEKPYTVGPPGMPYRRRSAQTVGLTQRKVVATAEAAQRLQQYGANQLDEKPRPTFFQLVLGQLNNFVVILLIVAAVISAMLGEYMMPLPS